MKTLFTSLLLTVCTTVCCADCPTPISSSLYTAPYSVQVIPAASNQPMQWFYSASMNRYYYAPSCLYQRSIVATPQPISTVSSTTVVEPEVPGSPNGVMSAPLLVAPTQTNNVASPAATAPAEEVKSATAESAKATSESSKESVVEVLGAPGITGNEATIETPPAPANQEPNVAPPTDVPPTDVPPAGATTDTPPEPQAEAKLAEPVPAETTTEPAPVIEKQPQPTEQSTVEPVVPETGAVAPPPNVPQNAAAKK